MHDNVCKRILIVAPSFPVVESGAEQQDRAEGIRQLVRLGYEVSVIAKVVGWADREAIEKKALEWGVHRCTLVPYRYSNRNLTRLEKVKKFLGKFRHLLYFDGAAYEYAEVKIQQTLRRELEDFRPDIVWFEYTYLWPLYEVIRRANIPIITRSINYEPSHFLDEDGHTLLNCIKYVPKFFSERRSICRSDMVLAITPREESLYVHMGARKVMNLPLRSLANFVSLSRPEIRARMPLHVFFMGSSYAVEHNRAAARQVIREIAPEVEKLAPGQFIFHIFGGKLSESLQNYCDGTRVIYEGYEPDLNVAMRDMDIALIPSLMGAGMQQKVFEPITRGIPTITSPRAIAGYPLSANVEYAEAHTTKEFVEALLSLRYIEKRYALVTAASRKTAHLFSSEALDAIVEKALYAAIHGR